MIGGTGRTGSRIADVVVERGHVPVVIGRSARPDRVPAGAVAAPADVLDSAALQSALAGCDAVVLALSIPRTSRSPWAPLRGPGDLHSRSLPVVLGAMEAHGIGRIVKVSAQGVGDSAPRAGWGFRALVAASNLRHAFRDHAVADEALRGTPVRWTIVRPPMLVDGEGPGVRGEVGVTTWTWTRVHTGDVASFVVAALTDPATERRVLTLVPATGPR